MEVGKVGPPSDHLAMPVVASFVGGVVAGLAKDDTVLQAAPPAAFDRNDMVSMGYLTERMVGPPDPAKPGDLGAAAGATTLLTSESRHLRSRAEFF